MARNTKKTEVEVVATTDNTTPVKYGIEDLFAVTGRLVPLHPVKLVPMDAWLELVGVDSEEFDNAVRAMLKTMKNRKEELTEEETKQADDDFTRELAARCIVDWDEAMFGPFSTEAAIELMKNRRAKWLFVQVQKFIEDQSNFYKA